ncbi:MAG TPA: TolC family protein, partial [Candidatus Hydrogenedentes bacterium]|nr:TolC family protein [Candidatus Hydrogenedentota bacterium]
TAEKLAFVNLRRVLFLDDTREVTVAGEIPWDPLDTPVETLVARALAARPELAALDRGIEAARQNVLVKRGAFYPKVAATAQYQQVDGGGKLMPDGFTLGMGAEWEFWPGGKRKHELREAESQTRQLELQRAGVARLVETDVRQAHARALEAVAKIKREKAASRLGEEGQELAELRFQEGAGIQAETLDAELALTTARTGLAKALRDYAVALTDLERALGGGLPEAAQAEK